MRVLLHIPTDGSDGTILELNPRKSNADLVDSQTRMSNPIAVHEETTAVLMTNNTTSRSAILKLIISKKSTIISCNLSTLVGF